MTANPIARRHEAQNSTETHETGSPAIDQFAAASRGVFHLLPVDSAVGGTKHGGRRGKSDVVVPSTPSPAHDLLPMCVSIRLRGAQPSHRGAARSWTCRTKRSSAWGMRGPCSTMPTDGRCTGQLCPALVSLFVR